MTVAQKILLALLVLAVSLLIGWYGTRAVQKMMVSVQANNTQNL